jgi:hypothetical protein
LRSGAQNTFKIGLLRCNPGGQTSEITGGIALQGGAIFEPTGWFHSLVHRIARAFGLIGVYHSVQIFARRDSCLLYHLNGRAVAENFGHTIHDLGRVVTHADNRVGPKFGGML